MAEETKKKKTLWNFVDSLEGDKVVWMIVILLILFSIVAIFSSTSLLALQQKTTRMAIISEQMVVSLVGLGVIIVCCCIKKIGFFRIVSQLGYAVSIGLLSILALHISAGPVKALYINHAWRIVSVFGFQVHVFEVVKVAMIMYLAWAVNAFRNDSFVIANLLGEKYPFWKKPLVKKFVYLPPDLQCLPDHDDGKSVQHGVHRGHDVHHDPDRRNKRQGTCQTGRGADSVPWNNRGR